MEINQKRLAFIAGVSQATVSRVLSGSDDVKEDLKSRVLKACKKVSYFPHAGARAMREGRFKRIAAAVVQYGKKETVYTPNNGYLDPAADALAEYGYSLVLETFHLDYDDSFITPPKLFSEIAVDGVLGLPTSGLVPAGVDKELERLGAPIVWMNRNSGPGITTVMCDEYQHGRMLAKHLIDLGHERIGYLGFDSPHYAAQARLRGITDELRAAGLDTSRLLMGERPPKYSRMVNQLLDQDKPVSAVIAYSVGGVNTLTAVVNQRGLAIPRDLSVCHFASAWHGRLYQKPPTMLVLPEVEMARYAVDQMMATINGEKYVPNPRLFVGSLHQGWTTAPPA